MSSAIFYYTLALDLPLRKLNYVFFFSLRHIHWCVAFCAVNRLATWQSVIHHWTDHRQLIALAPAGMTPLKRQISLMPFSIEHWYSPYERRRFENQWDQTFCILLIKEVLSVSLHSVTRPIAYYYPPFARRAKGEVFVLLYVCLFVRSTISQQPTGRFTPNFACGRSLGRDVSSPLLGSATPWGKKRGNDMGVHRTFVHRTATISIFLSDAKCYVGHRPAHILVQNRQDRP